jgi:hypothetical protein
MTRQIHPGRTIGVSGCDNDERAYPEQVECQALTEISVVCRSLQEFFFVFLRVLRVFVVKLNIPYRQ